MKKYLFLLITVLSVSLMSCSGDEDILKNVEDDIQQEITSIDTDLLAGGTWVFHESYGEYDKEQKDIEKSGKNANRYDNRVGLKSLKLIKTDDYVYGTWYGNPNMELIKGIVNGNFFECNFRYTQYGEDYFVDHKYYLYRAYVEDGYYFVVLGYEYSNSHERFCFSLKKPH